MNIDSELLSKTVDMLKTFAADQVALDPGSRGEYSHKQCVEVIEELEEKLTIQQRGPVFDGGYCGDISEKERQAYNNGVLAGYYDPEATLLSKKPDRYK